MANDIEKKLNDLGAVLDIARAMMAEKDLRALMDLIVSETTKVMGADRSSLYLVDEGNQELFTWIAEGLQDKQIRVPIGEGIAGHVAKTRKPLNVEDAYRCPHFDQEWDKKTGYRTRSVLCLPLFTHDGTIVGVLQVINKREGVFADYDESLLDALGSLAAVALDNNRLVRHYVEKKQIQHSLQIARQIQQGLLPDHNPSINGFDIAGWTLSCDETGGDYYDFIEMDDGRLGIAVGDVSSHGVGPALLMSTARAFLRALIAGNIPLAAILAQLNDFLVDDMGEGRFMTLFYGVLDPKNKTVNFTSAGHEPAVIMRRGSEEFCEAPNTGCPLGIVPGTPFPEAIRFPFRRETCFCS
ncbi:MAG: SpoIIE family protein phosphatase [Planctomycetes bacterium]|nr:SpoIIE family protein phosphatase [Planctomycetota bacterium]